MDKWVDLGIGNGDTTIRTSTVIRTPLHDSLLVLIHYLCWLSHPYLENRWYIEGSRRGLKFENEMIQQLTRQLTSIQFCEYNFYTMCVRTML